MNALLRLCKMLQIEPQELRRFLGCCLHAFLVGSVFELSYTPAYTLFFQHFSVQYLPFIYVTLAVGGSALTAGIMRLQSHFAMRRFLCLLLGLVAVVLVGLRVTAGVTTSRWLFFALLVWGELAYRFVRIESNLFVGQLFDLRQGKRLFGLIEAGALLGQITGGLSMGFLVSRMGAINVVCLAAGLAVVAMGMVLWLIPAAAAPRTGANGDLPAVSSRDMLRRRYVILHLLLMICVTCVYYVADTAFFREVSFRYADEAAIASFLGRMSATLGALTLVTLVFVSGHVLTRYGLLAGLLIMPLGMMIGGSTITLTGLLGGQAALIFGLTACVHVMKGVMSSSFNIPSQTVICQVMPPAQRAWVQSTANGIVDPLTTGAIGLVLVVLLNTLSYGTVQLFQLLVPISLFWAVTAIFVHREYLAALFQALARRRLAGVKLDLRDGSSVSILRKGLTSRHAPEVLYCLQLFQETNPDKLPEVLAGLLTHPASEVRREAARRIGSGRLADVLPSVLAAFDRETDAPVRCEILHTLLQLGDPAILERFVAYLDDADAGLRMGAMTGLLEHPETPGGRKARERLRTLARSALTTDRRFAAEILNAAPQPEGGQVLDALLGDPDRDVRRWALRAARRHDVSHEPAILRNLSVPGLASAATSALVALGEPAEPLVVAGFLAPETDRALRIRLAHVLGRLGGRQAIAALREAVSCDDEGVRTEVLRGLVAADYQVAEADRPQVHDAIIREVREAAWADACAADLGDDPSVEVLQRAFAQMIERHRERVLLLIACQTPKGPILKARQHLAGASAEKRAFAMEIIDSAIPREVRSMILPLLESLSAGERRNGLEARFAQGHESRTARLLALGAGQPAWAGPWLRCCALFSMGVAPAPLYGDMTRAAMSAANPLVRETAGWALARLGGNP